MDPVFLILRILHVVLGAFWVGTIFFFTVFLLPSMGEMGPDAGKLMGALQKRRYMTVMAIVAPVTILSGFVMYYRLSGGFDSAYMKSPHGMAYGIGGAAALVAMGFGLLVIRPAAEQLGPIMGRIPTLTPGAERDGLMAQAQKLRQRTGMGSRIVASLLFVTILMMAVARYL